MYFLRNNLGTILVLIIVAVCIIFAIRKIILDRRNGKSSCMGICSECKKCNNCSNSNQYNAHSKK